MHQFSFTEWAIMGLMALSYVFITVKSIEWLLSILLRKWLRRRRQPLQDRIMSEFCDAFDIDEMTPGTQKLLITKGDIVVYVIKRES